MSAGSRTRKDQTIMKVSEFLKKVGYIDTPEESADRIIRRAAEYTLQEINFTDNAVMITGIRKERRTPGRKPDK